MRFRTYKNTHLTASEVGFGLWTISTGWWGNFTEGEAIALMHKAFDLGITLFDAADTYGNGLSEELIAKAFPKQRDEITIAIKAGYDFLHHGEARGRGQREIPQDFSPEAVTRATDAGVNRLKTDRTDLVPPHKNQIEQGYGWPLGADLGKLKSGGKGRFYRIAPGPAIRWLCNGCSQTLASLRLCRTFTTKNNSLNSPGRRNVRRSPQTTWQKLTNFIPTTSESKKNHRNSREQWSCRRKRQRRRHEFETR